MPNHHAEELKHFFESIEGRSGKPLSKITIANYCSKINKLSQIVTGETWNGDSAWLYDVKKVVSAIDKANVTGRKDFLSPVIRMLKHANAESSIISEYQKALSGFKNDEYASRKKNMAKKEHVDNSLSLSDIVEKIKAYKGDNSMYKLICALYFMNTLVPRNDLNIVKLASDKKKTKDLNHEHNYILTDNGKPTSMVWINYKSNHTFGVKKFAFTPYVQALLTDYIKKTGKQNGDYLFTAKNGEPYKKQNFLGIIADATKEILGKPMGVDLIRQIQVTDYYRSGVKTIEQDEKDAERYTHSILQHKEYYRKNLAEGSGSEADD